MEPKELREQVRTALASLEERFAELEAASDDDTADLDAYEQRFQEAQAVHTKAVERLERAEAIAQAKRSLPVEPVQDTDDEGVKSPRIEVGKEPLTYERHSSTSVFRDLMNQASDPAASARLQRHREEMLVERRDLSSTDAAGGYLVAPLYLQDEFVSYARAGRVAADVIGSRPLPPNTDSINIPTQDGGVSVAAQADNASVSETDATFNTVAADVKTIAGLQDVSQQLVDRSVPGIDSIIFADLAKAYAVTLDTAVLNSSTSNNKGLLQVSSINSVTYTDASPTVAELYPKLADAVQQVGSNIYMPAQAWLMHPRRWATFLAATDTNRPLIVPNAQGPQNAAGTFGGVEAEGYVGSLHGLPVFVDPNIPTTLGSGTNEDRIICIRTDELFLWEDQGGPYLDTFRDVGSGTLTVRFRLFNYYAQCHARRPKAISAISGTGLATPTF